MHTRETGGGGARQGLYTSICSERLRTAAKAWVAPTKTFISGGPGKSRAARPGVENMERSLVVRPDESAVMGVAATYTTTPRMRGRTHPPSRMMNFQVRPSRLGTRAQSMRRAKPVVAL